MLFPPGHDVAIFAGVATTIWAGREGSASMRSAVRDVAASLGLAMKILSRDTPLGRATGGSKDLLTEGGSLMTSRAWVGSSLLTPSKLVTSPSSI